MATPNYEINYEDERFTQVENEKQQALTNVNNTYNNMINSSDKFYQDQINAVKDYEQTQSKIQQENTDFAIEKIEQQKEQAGKDYTKEQQGAYVDWQKQSNQYGANAEAMAQQGLTNTGYSESSQVSMYNTYQNRVATARDVFNRAILNYDNSIKEAQLANNAKLAEIAYNALQAQLELSLQGFQYKNQLIEAQLNMQNETEDRYYSRWQDVLTQMNQENQFNEQIRQFEQNYELQTKQLNESIRQFNEEIARLKKKDEQENKLAIQQLELQKKQLEEQKRQANLDYNLRLKQLNASKSSSSGGSSSVKKGSSSSSSVNKGSSSGSSTVRKEAISKMQTTLSSLYKSIYKGSASLGDKTADAVARQAQKDALASAYKSGQITKAEFEQLAEKYGF